jgi:hypothetical protein
MERENPKKNIYKTHKRVKKMIKGRRIHLKER